MRKEDISLLRIYAKNNMNCVKTAKEMGIHQSSVIYRFGKIKTETGLDARKFWTWCCCWKWRNHETWTGGSGQI